MLDDGQRFVDQRDKKSFSQPDKIGLVPGQSLVVPVPETLDEIEI